MDFRISRELKIHISQLMSCNWSNIEALNAQVRINTEFLKISELCVLFVNYGKTNRVNIKEREITNKEGKDERKKLKRINKNQSSFFEIINIIGKSLIERDKDRNRETETERQIEIWLVIMSLKLFN